MRPGAGVIITFDFTIPVENKDVFLTPLGWTDCKVSIVQPSQTLMRILAAADDLNLICLLLNQNYRRSIGHKKQNIIQLSTIQMEAILFHHSKG